MPSHLALKEEWVETALREWIERLRGGEHPSLVIRHLLETARKLTQAQTALLVLPDESQQYADFAVVVGRGEEDLLGLRLRVEQTVLEETLLRGSDWHYFSAETSEESPRSLRKGRGGLRSGCAVPLPGSPGAALVVVNRKGSGAFEPETCLLLHTLATHLPMLLHVRDLQRRIERQEQERQLLETASLSIGRELHLQAVLTNALTILHEIEGFFGAVWFYNEERTRLYQVDSYGWEAAPQAFEVSTEWEQWAARTEVQSLSEEQIRRLFPNGNEAILRSLLIAPLRTQDATLGFLMVGSPKPEAYSERDQRLLKAITSQVALAAANALLYEQVARRARDTAALYELSVQLGTLESTDAVYQLLTQTALKLIPADHAVLYLSPPHHPTTPPPHHLTPACVQPPHEALSAHSPHAQHSLPGWVYAFNAPLAVAELATNPHNQKEPLPADFHSALAVPLQVADRAFGVLMVLTAEPHLFTLADMELLFTIGNTGALTLTNLWRRAS